MLRRFTPTEAFRVAIDNLYVKKTALHKLEGIVAYVPHDQHPKGYCTTCLGCHDSPTSRPPNKENVAPAQWHDKGETIYSAQDQAAYEPEPEHWGASNDIPESTAPSHADPITRHVLSYLNSGGDSNKTTQTIDLFQARNPLVFTPTHRLATEMRTRGGEGPDIPLLPLELTNWVDARRHGSEVHPACDNMGWGVHGPQARARDLPRLARPEGSSGDLLWGPRTATSDRRGVPAWLALWEGRLLRSDDRGLSQQVQRAQGTEEGHSAAAGQGSVPGDAQGFTPVPGMGQVCQWVAPPRHHTGLP